MTTTSEMLTAVRDALASDAVISKWCIATYGTAHSVFLGFNDENPPTEADYPMITITDAVQNRGSDKHRITWDVSIGIVISRDKTTTVNNAVTCDGFLEVETLRELAENALYRAKLASMDSGARTMSLSDYPQFASITTIKITLPASSQSGISKRL